MPVGNPVALCDTHHAGNETLTRPMSEYFANALTVVLLCGVQGSNHIVLVLDTYVHYTESHFGLERMDVQNIFSCNIHSVHKKTKPDNFCIILFRTDEIL